MNKTLLLALALTALTATTANARSWRINNDETKMAQFTSINAAMSSTDVVAGDTLYLDPGCSLTAEQTVSKRVTIIGTGYTGVSLPHRGAYISGKLYLNAANTKLLSLNITGTVYIRNNNITIERCRCSSGIVHNYNSSSYTSQYTTIRDCYVTTMASNGTTSTNSAFWTIENNIISSENTCISGLYNATIRNNLILNTYISNISSYHQSRNCLSNLTNCQIVNNIILKTASSYRNYTLSGVDATQLNNNVISSNTRPDFNKANVTATDSVYTGDVQSYVLTDDSPARGYGQDGTDCGIFGGLYPYVKGGLAYGHPYYESFVISSMPVDGKINVSLKVKMQDE